MYPRIPKIFHTEIPGSTWESNNLHWNLRIHIGISEYTLDIQDPLTYMILDGL